MIEFKVPDITCGHCASAIARAVKDQDPHAKIAVSIADRTVRVETDLPGADIEASLIQAGYPPSAS